MIADELRAAAARIRGRAEHATPGNWIAATGRGKLGVVGVTGPTGPGSGIAVAVSATSGNAKTANAEHIAAWGPGRALAVAAWLDLTAGTHAATALQLADGPVCQTCGRDVPCPDVAAALGVARAVLGGAA